MDFLENIREMIYPIGEKSVFSEKESFDSTFYNFIENTKAFIKKNKNREEYEYLKFDILELLEKVKNSKLLSQKSKDSYINMINSLLFSSKLNKIKSVSHNYEKKEDYVKLEKFLSLSFEVSEKRQYSLWCYLKIADILKDIFKQSENNIVSENIVDLDSKVLKFIFSDNTKSVKIIYNHRGVLGSNSTIYFLTKRTGYEPVYYGFICKNEQPKYEEIERLHIIRDTLFPKNNENDRLFSGLFILYPESSVLMDEYEKTSAMSIGAVSFDISNNQNVIDLITKISDYQYSINKSRNISAISQKLFINEIEKRNVLIATVKSKEQLEENLKNNSYYMPLSKVDISKFNYEYIAIYQSKSLFQEVSGIMYYGEICDMKIVRRSEIQEILSDSEELYVYFTINWKILKNKIETDLFITSFSDTSLFLLENMSRISQLFIRYYEEYYTYEFLLKYFDKIKLYGNEQGIYTFKADNIKIEFNFTTVEFFKNDSQISSFSRFYYRRNIKAILTKFQKKHLTNITEINGDN